MPADPALDVENRDHSAVVVLVGGPDSTSDDAPPFDEDAGKFSWSSAPDDLLPNCSGENNTAFVRRAPRPGYNSSGVPPPGMPNGVPVPLLEKFRGSVCSNRWKKFRTISSKRVLRSWFMRRITHLERIQDYRINATGQADVSPSSSFCVLMQT